ncbi:MAG: hypothetical protein ACK5XV_01540 [Flavobacteriales bacterium]
MGFLKRFSRIPDRIRYPLLLVALILLAIYPFSFFLFIPKWDTIIGYLPYRYFIGDYLHHGHLPLWSPFQRMGYPGYADLQSGAWYPVLWFLLLFGKYTITSIMCEVILTFLIAGLGMYRLTLDLLNDRRIALWAGLAYSLSGFMTGSTQLLVFLIGAAWLPWCIWSFRRWLRYARWSHALAAMGFAGMNITGASPAFTIILIYILTGMGLIYAWRQRASSGWWKRLIPQSFAALIFLGALLAPLICSYLDFAPYFNRAGKLPMTSIALNPFTWPNYISFLLPYTVISHTDWFASTDLSLRNAYIGVAGLCGIWGATRAGAGRSGLRFILLACAASSLVLALGNETPIYKLVYHLPGFGLFRHPSFFRIYAILCLLLLAALGWKAYLLEGAGSVSLRRGVIVLLLLVGVAGIIAGASTSFGQVYDQVREVLSGREFLTSPPGSHVLLNALFVLLLFAVTYLSMIRFRWSLFTALLVFTAVDLMVQTSLTARTTMVYPITYADARTYFNNLPAEHDQTYNSTAMKQLDDRQGLRSAPGFELNLATFNKVPSIVGENPLRFRRFDLLQHTPVMDLALENPVMYVPTQSKLPIDSVSPGLLWSPVGCIGSPLMQLDSVVIGYNTFSGRVCNSSGTGQYLILNQNYHHLWTASLDGMPLQVGRINELVMGAIIPAGASGEVEFRYRSPALLPCIVLSVLSWLLALALMIRIRQT